MDKKDVYIRYKANYDLWAIANVWVGQRLVSFCVEEVTPCGLPKIS